MSRKFPAEMSVALPFRVGDQDLSFAGPTEDALILHTPGSDFVSPNIGRLKASVSNSGFRVNPYDIRKWSDRDERDFDNLAFKKAQGELSVEEDMKFRQMTHARNRDLPQHTAEEVMLTAEHNQLLNEMHELLEKFRVFRLKHGSHFEIESA